MGKQQQASSGKLAAARSIALAGILVFSSLFAAVGLQIHQAAWAYTYNTANPQGTSPNARMAVSGTGPQIYLAWQEFDANFLTHINLARSTDGGLNFDTATLSSNATDSFNPQIAVSGDRIYVTWEEQGEIFLASATDSNPATTMEDLISSFVINNTSNSPADSSFGPQAAAFGSNVYLAWLEQGEVFFSESADDGATFTTPISLSDTPDTDPFNTQLAAFGGGVYAVWQDTDPVNGTSDIYFAARDPGDAAFSEPVNLSSATANESANPVAAASAGNVLVAWQETDFAFFGTPYRVVTIDYDPASGTLGTSSVLGATSPNKLVGPLRVGSGGANNDVVFLSWEEVNNDLATGEIFAAASSDGGESFACASRVGTTLDSISANPTVMGDGAGNVFSLWWDLNGATFNEDILFDETVDYQTEFFESTIPPASPLRWGLDTDRILSYGRVANTDPANSVIVDWGNGQSDTISPSSCFWEVSHVYNSTAVGLRDVAVNLVDGTGATVLPGPTFQTEVIAHSTSLTLDALSSVNAGSDVTATGLLLDNDAGEGMAGASITFTGTGAENAGGLSSVGAVTDADGTFSASAPSPDSVAAGWEVQAHFAGDGAYFPSDSAIELYNTNDPGTPTFNVTAGLNQVVSLTGFNASITFEEVLSPGTVSVSQCTESDNARFLVLGGSGNGTSSSACMVVSPAVNLAPGSSALIQMSFAGLSIPSPYDAGDIDVFFESAGPAFVDITASRNAAGGTVTGNTTAFGKFVAGVALHDSPSAGGINRPVYIGPSQTISIRDISNTAPASEPEISLDEEEYDIGETAVLTIVDADRNIDVQATDTITAQVSSRSDETGITLVLTENGANSGVFWGTFVLTDGPSSGNMLHAEPRDRLVVAYAQAPGARFSAVVNGYSEAGLVELTDALLTPSNVTGFARYGGGVNLDLVDSQLDGSATVSVTISYANIDLGNNDPMLLGIYQRTTLLDAGGNEVDFWQELVSSTVNPAAKTVTAQASTIDITASVRPSLFILGYDIGEPGGAGGGVSLPGAGLVLDFLAPRAIKVAESDSSSGGGGGGGGGGTPSSVTVNTPTTTPTATDGEQQTYESSYFETKPLEKAQILSSEFVATNNAATDRASEGEQVSVKTEFRNFQKVPQSYAFIVQVVDENGFTVDLGWETGTVQSGETVKLSRPWTGEESGTFTFKIFIWDGTSELPTALSEPEIEILNVTE